jgi:hypothetical protein
VPNYVPPAPPGPKAISGDSFGVANFKLKARERTVSSAEKLKIRLRIIDRKFCIAHGQQGLFVSMMLQKERPPLSILPQSRNIAARARKEYFYVTAMRV